MTDPTVYIVEDDSSVRRSTERLVRAMGYVTRSFASAADFLEYVSDAGEEPGCVLLDAWLPDIKGLELQQRLLDAGIPLSVVFVTAYGDIPMAVQAMKNGASDFLTKPFQAAALLNAVHAAIEQSRKDYGRHIEKTELHERYQKLTPREREVLALVAAGRLNKQIAGELKTTVRTIKFHRGHVMRKMNAESLAHLVRMVERLGLFRQEETIEGLY